MKVEFAKNYRELAQIYDKLEEPYRKEGTLEKSSAERAGVPEGTPMTYIPEPKTNPERFKRLINLESHKRFESFKSDFGGKFGFKEQHIKEEITKIELFINEAEKFSPQKAFKGQVRAEDRLFVEYQRLKLNYYDRDRDGDELCNYYLGSPACEVYTQCYLWLPFLKTLIEETPAHQLTNPQKALVHIYQKTPLVNGTQKLKQTFEKLDAPGSAGKRNRRCSGESKRALTTRLSDLKIIRPMINSPDGISILDEDQKAIEEELQRINN
jgi:hypothetical protein